MSAQPRIAGWLPPALLDAPHEDGAAPRLLAALLAAVDEQRAELAADIDELWDDFFVESCADWAVPYVAALVGLGPDAERREVAYAIALRRRKGTPAALEDFVEVLSGWRARAVEGWQVTTWAQLLDHPGSPRPAALDLRRLARDRVGTPFERITRTVAPGGRSSPRTVTAFAWPWQIRSYRMTRAVSIGNRRYALHPFGVEAPLYVRPRARPLAGDGASGDGAAHRGDELDVPARATYRLLEALAVPSTGEVAYGERWKLGAEHPVAGKPGETPPLVSLTAGNDPVPWSAIRFGSVPAGNPPPAAPGASEVVVDIVRGHVLLGSNYSAGVRAFWHRPVSGAIGALAAEPRSDPGARVVVTVDPSKDVAATRRKTLEDAITLAESLSANLDPAESTPDRPDVEIRLETSERISAPTVTPFAPRLPRWRIVAPTFATPVVNGDLALDLTGASLSLEGFLLNGNLRLGKGLRSVRLDALTMNPVDGAMLFVHEDAWMLALEARRSILAPIRAELAAAPIRLTDCIVDGAGKRQHGCGAPSAAQALRAAIAKRTRFAPAVRAERVTFVGRVAVERIDAADCLFVHGLEALQHQEGCLRHCYLGPPEPTPSHPQTYRCLTYPPPAFVSEGFEAGGYYALELDHPLAVAASDGGEIGAYNHARRSQKLSRLNARIHEFVPLGLRSEVALAPWEE